MTEHKLLQKQQILLHAIITPCFNNKTLPPVQVGYVKSENVEGPLSSS